MKIFVLLAVALLFSVEAGATPYWLVNGGIKGTSEKSSMGVEVGSTNLLLGKYPLAAELSMNFDFDDVPSDTFFNVNRYNEPYFVTKANYGPEIGYLFKSGVNLDDWVKNLTLQVGAGFSLQSVVNVGTGLVTGKHWEQGDKETDVHAVGYGGLLYRLERLTLSLGYNNRRGVVTGIGSSW